MNFWVKKILFILFITLTFVNVSYSQITYHGVELTNFDRQEGFEDCEGNYCRYNVGIFKKAVIFRYTKMISFVADKSVSENDIYKEVRNLIGREPDGVNSTVINWNFEIIRIAIVFLQHTTQVAITPRGKE